MRATLVPSRVPRSRRAVAALVALVSVLLSSACTSDPVIDWAAGPIQIELSPDGIEVTGQAAWVTPLGRFAIGEKYSGEAGKAELILDIRHRQGGAVVDDVYKIPTSADVWIAMNGRVQVGIRGRTVLVDATGADIQQIVLTGVTWDMPDLRGINLQEAQDRLEKFTNGEVSYTSTYDASGRGRSQNWDLDWTVCTQSVLAGQAISVDSTIGFGVVKNDEQCPNGLVPTSAVWVMPSLVGTSLNAANDELQTVTSGAIESAHTHDATGAGASQYFDSDWQVCSQIPAPASTITAETPIEFGVVPLDGRCPSIPY